MVDGNRIYFISQISSDSSVRIASYIQLYTTLTFIYILHHAIELRHCRLQNEQKSAPHLIKVPGFKPEHSKVTGDRWIEVIKRHRVVDERLKNQIAKRSLGVCELHFRSDQIYKCKNILTNQAPHFNPLYCFATVSHSAIIIGYVFQSYSNLYMRIHMVL